MCLQFPGRTIDAKSIGCNKLIKENKAALLSDPEEFIELMGWNDAEKRKEDFTEETV